MEWEIPGQSKPKGYKCVLIGTEDVLDDTIKIELEKHSDKKKRMTEVRLKFINKINVNSSSSLTMKW